VHSVSRDAGLLQPKRDPFLSRPLLSLNHRIEFPLESPSRREFDARIVHVISRGEATCGEMSFRNMCPPDKLKTLEEGQPLAGI